MKPSSTSVGGTGVPPVKNAGDGRGRPSHHSPAAELLPALKQYFGYTSFRPLQEQIIQAALGGRDALAVLPTGGGKSLCFQLPAVLRPGLTVVVSPLIALMKDQVDALLASGITATFLNSSIDNLETQARIQDLQTGNCRLLYAAPERLVQPGFIAALRNWNVTLIAVDEAHCISDWGHDFRPEYRQLADLRAHFPGVPVLALTATATPRVQDDIVSLLKLRAPGRFVASFNRPNLSYRVLPKESPDAQALEFVRQHAGESGIIYCQSRQCTEDVAEHLRGNRIQAAAYHAGMNPADRGRTQELFLRDEIRVICATIAFGMGINKPNVRFVMHYDLPKNIEGYYQETGRAGRDSLPSNCLLLFSRGDVAKQMHFIDEKPNEQEREVARKQLYTMIEYAESSQCRRAELLKYFGETYAAPDSTDCNGCGACDNCLTPRDKYDGTLPAQKLLSCVYRIRQMSGFDCGLNHAIEVLRGADTENVRKRGHHGLTTYGIGKEFQKKEWQAIGRELIRLGLLEEVAADKFTVVGISARGLATLKDRKPIQLTRPLDPTPAPEAGGKKSSAQKSNIECDEALFERLRLLRKKLADERDVPAYIIFSDVSLRQMARDYPSSEDEFARISGVGEQKRRDFAAAFLNDIKDHLKSNPRQAFVNPGYQPSSAAAKPKGTRRETLQLFNAGQSVDAIASARGLTTETIYHHLEVASTNGEFIDLDRLLSAEQQKLAAEAFAKIGWNNLTGARDLTGGAVSYGQLRLFRAMRADNKSS